jgi:hypothetical protein
MAICLSGKFIALFILKFDVMKTDILHAAKGIEVDPAITLDGFIVKETLATGVLGKTTATPKEKLFTAADLRNIQKRGRTARRMTINRSL